MNQIGYLFTGVRERDAYMVDLTIAGLTQWSKMHREPIIVYHVDAPEVVRAAGLYGLECRVFSGRWKRLKAVFAFQDDRLAAQAHVKGILTIRLRTARSRR